MRSGTTQSLLAAMTLLFAGCWTPQHNSDVWPTMALRRSRVVTAVEVEEQVDAVRALVTTIDPRDDVTPKPGDAVVYSIDVENPSESYRRYIRFTLLSWQDDKLRYQKSRITMTSPALGVSESVLRSRVFPVRIELFDENGEKIEASDSSEAPVEMLERGFAEACREHLLHKGEELSPEEAVRISMLDSPALFALSDLLEKNEVLYDLALDLVDWSLALTTLWNFGIEFAMEPRLHLSEEIAADSVLGRRAWRFPLQFKVNERPALRIAVTAIDPIAPLGLTAGITRIDGFRPTDDRYRVRMQLIAPASPTAAGGGL